VLLVTLDATRADALSSYGGALAHTPRLDELARESVRFSQAITTAPYTGPSHASLLTGLYPPQHGLRDFLQQRMNDDVPTLAELLRRQGYRTAAFVSTYVLDRRFGLGRGFERYSGDFWEKATPDGRPRPVQGSASFERPASETIDEALGWIRSERTAQPFFVWIHLFDAHAPYEPPPAFRRAWPDPNAVSELDRRRLRYYDEVRYMDSEVGRLLDALRSTRTYDRLLVVVTADHGELLGYHDGRRIETHSTHLVESTLRVPLLVRIPGVLAPGVVDAQVSLVDVMPTLLDVLGVPAPAGVAGRSLVPLARGEEEAARPAYSETLYERFPHVALPGNELVSFRRAGWKLLTRPGRSELYDLAADPHALHDVASAQPEKLAELQDALEEQRARFAAHPDATPLGLSEEEERGHIERLRSLGYVE